ncbi:hypothetical protein L1987_30732 [Smallanthus sonchifolius]|uniref:Uncharacterized protein n=1 Tax=Smallanthus sonchifolius TaxID=185202 RepID=A0ACB9I4T5_9ASTR|nr:hypothetical protein L1987_30732 [Smallanthus sonchifolius]
MTSSRGYVQRKVFSKAFIITILFTRYSHPIVVVLHSIARVSELILIVDREERVRCGQLVAWLLAVQHVHAVHAKRWFLGLADDLLELHIVVSLLFL